jgi:hypothetical protein
MSNAITPRRLLCYAAATRHASHRPARSITIPAAIALSVLLVDARSAQQTAGRTPIDLSKLGPQVGEQVPDFRLVDQTGNVWTRQSITGPRGAMLVFFRSADW